MSKPHCSNKSVLCIVPQNGLDSGQNPGGQITAANGLIGYIRHVGYKVDVVDTAENSFPIPPLNEKLRRVFFRGVLLFGSLQREKYLGAVLFSGLGLSFFERIVQCVLIRCFGTRCVIFFRNSDILYVKKGSARGFFLRLALMAPNYIAVQGAVLKKHLLSMGIDKNRIFIVRGWVPPYISKKNSPKISKQDDDIHFVFVGRVVKKKGIEEIAEAIDLLEQKGCRFKFTFVGGGTLEPWLRLEKNHRNWGDNICIAGWRSPEEVRDFLSRSDVLVLPTYHREGFPNVLLEAFASGAPAISTAVGAIPETLIDGKNGFIVPVKNSLALFKAMNRYISNRRMLTQHSRSALESAVDHHDWMKNCGKLMNIFQVGI